MKKVKIGVIGCGGIARGAHIPAYTKNEKAEILYFCDIIPERARAAAKEYGSGAAVEDYREVLADPAVEAVSVCVPNYMHAPITIDALRAGKHVLCEKPAAKTYADAQKMKQAADESGKILNIGVVNRFNDGVNTVKKYIQSGRLGEVFHVYLSFRAHRSIPNIGSWFTNMEQAGGGALIDWGVHFIDLAMYCCGDPEPVTASGEVFSKLGTDIENYVNGGVPGNDYTSNIKHGTVYDVEDSVTALVRTAGPVISMNGAWAQNVGVEEMFIDFMGDRGGIRLQYCKGFKVYTSECGALVEYEPKFEMGHAFENEIDAFLNCVIRGEKNTASIDNAIITAKLMQAIYDSAAQHREVAL